MKKKKKERENKRHNQQLIVKNHTRKYLKNFRSEKNLILSTIKTHHREFVYYQRMMCVH